MAGGRPTKYKAEYARIAEAMCNLGAIDQEIADALDIHIATLYRWKSDHPEFCDSLKVGKESADDRVESALYKRATGYFIDTVKIFNHQGEALEVPYREYVAPDTTACIFWLKNRKSEEYRANPEGQGGNELGDAISKLIDKLPN